MVSYFFIFLCRFFQYNYLQECRYNVIAVRLLLYRAIDLTPISITRLRSPYLLTHDTVVPPWSHPSRAVYCSCLVGAMINHLTLCMGAYRPIYRNSSICHKIVQTCKCLQEHIQMHTCTLGLMQMHTNTYSNAYTLYTSMQT